jgi:transposase InsO family protein
MNQSTKDAILKERVILVKAYERIKKGEHFLFSTIEMLAEHHGRSRKWIWSLHRRYIAANQDAKSLLPRKRGPKRPHNRPPKEKERLVIKIHRKLKLPPSQISFLLLDRGIKMSVSGIRNIIGRYPEKEPIKEVSERYEKEYPGELGHIDVKKIPNIKGHNPKKKQYKAALIDDCTRIAYAERLSNKKAGTLSRFLLLATDGFLKEHGITFQAILSDNGKEFTTHHKKGRKKHPFERTLLKSGITHKYTRPYRPQTNGKAESFWRIWIDECWKIKEFSSWADYDSHHRRSIYRYNHVRRHGGIKYLTPIQKLNLILSDSMKKAA